MVVCHAAKKDGIPHCEYIEQEGLFSHHSVYSSMHGPAGPFHSILYHIYNTAVHQATLHCKFALTFYKSKLKLILQITVSILP